MKRISLVLTLFLVAQFALGTEEPIEIQSVDQRIDDLPDPAAKLFFTARLQRVNGDFKKALQTAAEVVVFHHDRPEWLAKSELLCAELYVELGMLDAADATIRQIQQIYDEVDVVKQADALQLKIETWKKEGNDE